MEFWNALVLVFIALVGFLAIGSAIWSIATLISKHHDHRVNNKGRVKTGRIILGILDFAFAANLAFWSLRLVITQMNFLGS